MHQKSLAVGGAKSDLPSPLAGLRGSSKVKGRGKRGTEGERTGE